MAILLTLIALGTFSLLERVLLSTIQHRHGPGSQTADGLALLLADGTKLYSKWGTTDRITTWYLLSTGIIFSLSVIILTATITTALHSWIHIDGVEWLLISAAGLLLPSTVLLPSLTGGAYTSISTIRALRGGLLADVAMETSIVVMATGQQAGATSCTTNPYYWLLPATCWWLTTMVIGGKPPFDITEAESEMIAGVMTEIAGGIFALSLLTETTELWLLLSIITTYMYTHITYTLILSILAATTYIGRVLLARYHINDVLILVLTKLMFIPVSFTNTICIIYFNI